MASQVMTSSQAVHRSGDRRCGFRCTHKSEHRIGCRRPVYAPVGDFYR